ncbi:MAG: sensor histidine kinase [Candidatus Binatia bacterium]
MSTRPLAEREALRVAGLYGVLASTWIAVSDRVVGAASVHTLKGLAFIAASSIVLYAILRREFRGHQRLELELASARDRALESEQLKRSVLANMNHEIRTPLNVITGYMSLIRDDLEAGVGPGPELLESIERASARLVETLTKVIDMARLESGDVKLVPKLVDIGALVAREVDKVREQALSKGLAIGCHNQLVPGTVVRCDEDTLERAISHLLDNAVKFTEQGRIDARLREENGWIVVDLIDTGIGIDSAFVAKLFAPFSQQQTGLTRRYEGSGLGLAISKRFLELNGARISIASSAGKGTSLTIRIPKAA